MTLPRILVIDDQYYWNKTERNLFLRRTNLAEIDLDTTDDELRTFAQAGKVAAAIFCSGQEKDTADITNSLDEVDSFIQAGWPSKTGWRWALIMLDMRFESGSIENNIPRGNADDDAFGLKILDHIIATYPEKDRDGKGIGNSEIPVIILSGIDGDVRDQREPQANLRGAIRYVEKKSLREETTKTILLEDGLIEDDRRIIIGRSLPILKMLRRARQAALKGRNLLILGHPGAGKTEVARYAHDHSLLRDADKFIIYTSSATTEKLQYAELFGWWYGAHSLADRSSSGKAENAHGGTLFIDEIGNLPSDCQSELLEYGRLHSDGLRSLRRLGNFPLAPAARRAEAENSVVSGGRLDPQSHSIEVNVLLLTATNAAIDDSACRREKGFRDDLYDRLTEYNSPLHVPSLAECTDDIPALFIHYLDKETRLIEGVLPKRIDLEVFEKLRNYEWPSNVSGLKSVATHVAWQARYFNDVYVRHLPPLQIPESAEQINASSAAAGDTETVRLRELGHQVAVLKSALMKSAKFESLPEILREIDIPSDKSYLEGYLEKLNGAYIFFFQRLMGAALNVSSEKFESAIKMLLNIDKKTKLGGTAQSYVNKIISGKFIALNPTKIPVKSRDKLKGDEKDLAKELIDIYKKGKSAKE